MRYFVCLAGAACCALGLWAAGSPVLAQLPKLLPDPIPPTSSSALKDCKSFAGNDIVIAGCSEVIRLNPRDVQAFKRRGDAYRFKYDYDRALADYNEAIRIDPSFASAFVARALIYSDGPVIDLDRAIADNTEAIRLDPKNRSAFANRGHAYARKGEYERAIADRSELIRLGGLLPGLGSGLCVDFAYRGDAYAGARKYDQAIADYSEAILRWPPCTLAREQRGIAYVLKGDYDKAIADLAGLTHPKHLLHLGLSYEGKGARDKAIDAYRKAVEVRIGEPTSPSDRQWVKEAKEAQARASERLAALLTPPPAPTAIAPRPPSTPLGRRVALVIGNAAYKVGPLVNPGNDATKVAETLKKLGFDKVVLERDLTTAGFRTALAAFASVAAGADLALVYYAGHGVEVGGRNYLLPVDLASATSTNIKLQGVQLDAVLDQLTSVRKLKLVVLDACRTELLVDRGGARGLVAVDPEPDTLVVYAAKAGTTAGDGVGRSHSPFAEAFLKHVTKAGVEVRQMFGYVTDDTKALTGGTQQPFTYSSLGGAPLYLHVK